MPKGPQGPKRPADVIGAAVMVCRIATGEIEELNAAPKSAAAELGSKGGKARFFHYNFCRLHKTLRVTPAQEASVTDELLTMEHLCAIMHAANAPKKRGPYKKTAA